MKSVSEPRIRSYNATTPLCVGDADVRFVRAYVLLWVFLGVFVVVDILVVFGGGGLLKEFSTWLGSLFFCDMQGHQDNFWAPGQKEAWPPLLQFSK